MKYNKSKPVKKSNLLLLIGFFWVINGIVSRQGIAQKSSTTVIVNVNVIPMDTAVLLENHAVIVEGDRVTAIGPVDEVALPKEAEVIEGSGNYLMPGLADMHMHFNFDPEPDFMKVFLAEGVTTVRNLNALPEHLKWRDEVNNGERIGPTIYTSGPEIVGPPDQSFYIIFWAYIMVGLLAFGLLFLIGLWSLRYLRGQAKRIEWKSVLKGTLVLIVIGVIIILTKVIPINAYTSQAFPFAYVPDTERRARAEVQRQAEAGYDCIKVYDWMTREQYLGAIDEAKKIDIYVIGHLDHGIKAALAAGLDEVAHVDEFMEYHLLEPISPRDFKPVQLDYEKIPPSVQHVVENKAMVVSNMSTDENTYEYLEAGPAYFKRPEYKVIRPETIEKWLGTRMVNWQGQQEWRRNTLQPFCKEMIQSLHAAGVPILTGTDTGVEGSLPSHIHRDLELLVEAGLSPYEALEAGTKNAGLSVRRMGIIDNFGTIKVGNRADFILIENNPLENVSHTRERIGVMVRGKWYSQQQLDRLVNEYISTF